YLGLGDKRVEPLVDADHDIEGLHNGVGVLVNAELEVIDGRAGHGRGHHSVADIDPDMRGGRSSLLRQFNLQDAAGAYLHLTTARYFAHLNSLVVVGSV